MGKEEESGKIIEMTVPGREYSPYSLALLRECEYCVFVKQGIVVLVKTCIDSLYKGWLNCLFT